MCPHNSPGLGPRLWGQCWGGKGVPGPSALLLPGCRAPGRGWAGVDAGSRGSSVHSAHSFPWRGSRPLLRTFRFLACVFKGERGPASGMQAGGEDTLAVRGTGLEPGTFHKGRPRLSPLPSEDPRRKALRGARSRGDGA